MKKRYMLLLLLLLAVGFAAVSTNLILNNKGTIGVSNLDVVFINANASTESIANISEDGKKITYSSRQLTKVGDEETLYYVVENKSKDYSAKIDFSLEVPILATGSIDEYLSYSFNSIDADETILEPGQVTVGSITFKLKKPALDNKSFSFNLYLDVAAVENDYKYVKQES